MLVGAPNLVLGGSHSGNIAAIDLIRGGNADILSSDYVPASLMEGVFKLPQSEAGITLPQAVRFASFNPARAVGLDDRGEIAADRRADLVRVRVIDDAPLVARGLARGPSASSDMKAPSSMSWAPPARARIRCSIAPACCSPTTRR